MGSWIVGALGATAGRGCKQLLTLKVNNCEKIRDRGLHWLGKGCRAIRFLDLSACPQVAFDSTCLACTGAWGFHR